MESHLRREILEQPTVLRGLISNQAEHIMQTGRVLRELAPRYMLVAARGTSDNAATYGKYLFGARNGLQVALATPSLFTIYQRPPDLSGALVVGISQSGQSDDILEVVREAHRQGALTLAITNDPESPLARSAQHVIALQAGQERSVAATKTYTAQLVALALLSAGWSEDEVFLEEIRHLPEAVASALDEDETVGRLAERYRYISHCVVIGRGYNYATSFEIALKIKELTYVAAEPYSSADFWHGPIALVQGGFPVLVIAPSGQVQPNVLKLINTLREREAELLVISDDDKALALAQTPLRLPVGVPEWLSPVVAVIPGQLLAYHLTLARGYDPDHPRGLRKVTITR